MGYNFNGLTGRNVWWYWNSSPLEIVYCVNTWETKYLCIWSPSITFTRHFQLFLNGPTTCPVPVCFIYSRARFLNGTVIGLNNAPIDVKITNIPKGLCTGDSSAVVGKKCDLCYLSGRGGSLLSSYQTLRGPNTRKRAHCNNVVSTREIRIGRRRTQFECVCVGCQSVVTVLYGACVLSIFVHDIYIAQKQLINSCTVLFFWTLLKNLRAKKTYWFTQNADGSE